MLYKKIEMKLDISTFFLSNLFYLMYILHTKMEEWVVNQFK